MMNKIISTLMLAGFVLACKPKSETITPKEIKDPCRILSYKMMAPNGALMENDIYTYNTHKKLEKKQGLYYTERLVYDAGNNLVKRTGSVTPDGAPITETAYFYSAANRLIKEDFYAYETGIGLKKRHETYYEYHANGKFSKIDIIYSDGSGKLSYTYNEKQSLVSALLNDGSTIKNEYNSQNLLIKETTYMASQQVTSENTHEYNAKNLKVKEIRKMNGIVAYTILLDYDDKNRKISEIGYNGSNGLEYKILTEYNGDNFKVTNYSRDNELINYTEWEVEKGFVRKKSMYNYNRMTSYETYDYNSYGNMTKRDIYEPGTTLKTSEVWVYECD